MISTTTPYKGRKLNWGRHVQVYRNLNKKGVWYSIKQDGYVVAHSSGINLKDCHFVVNESGRKRALKQKRRNVHAYIAGYPVGIMNAHDLRPFGKALLGRYDMAGDMVSSGGFIVHQDGTWYPVKSAMRVRLGPSGLEVWMPRS